MSATGQAVVTCWNCDQAVQATATSCLWCGVAVQPTVTPIVMAPSGAPPAPVAGEPSPVAEQLAPVAAQVPYNPSVRSPKREVASLSAAFAGTGSSVGAQVGAFTIDVFTVAALTLTVHLTIGSGLITALTLIEAMVFLWVLEARTGLTVGHLLLRIRVSRAAAPYSPGAGRAFVRQTILNAGLLGAVVGAWVVAASGTWDKSGQRRSLAARASRTRAVTPLPKTRTVQTTGVPGMYPTSGAPPATAPGAGLGAPRIVSTSVLGHPSIENSHAVSHTGVANAAGAHTGPELVTSLDPAAQAHENLPDQAVTALPEIAPVPGMAPEQAPLEHHPEHAQSAAVPTTDDHAQVHYPGPDAAAQQAPPALPDHPYPAPQQAAPTPDGHAYADPGHGHPAQGGALLLVFDTGQRVTLAMGTAINLGRKPGPVEPTDQLVAVEDPEGTVSKFHARLEHSHGQTWVTDQGSTNGTDILDEDGATRLEPGVRTLVEDGMRTRLGNRSFTVSVLLDPTPSPEFAS